MEEPYLRGVDLVEQQGVGGHRARIDVLEQRKFLRDEAKEFQLRTSRFGEKEYRLMFDISYPAHLTMKYPAAADTAHTGQWLHLTL